MSSSLLDTAEFAEVDAMLDQILDENTDPCAVEGAYESLKKRASSEKDNVEVLWRLAVCCNELAGRFEKKDRRKEKIIEGRQYALQAYNTDSKHFLAIKWTAILTGQLTNYVSAKERVELGGEMREYQDAALAMKPDDFILLHLRGRFAYSIATLSWLEKKAAVLLFGPLPELTMDDALKDFMAAFELKPDWIENLVYIARCHLDKKNHAAAMEYYSLAAGKSPRDAAETEQVEEAKAYIKKHGK